MKNNQLILLLILVLTGCTTKSKKEVLAISKTIPSEIVQLKADEILKKTIEAHGGDRYNDANYEFVFRDNIYTFKNLNGESYYAVKKVEKGKKIYDVIDNGTFKRTINGTKKELSKSAITKYSEALNSVIYFATLPHKLNDASVNKVYKGTTVIKNKAYEVLEISFSGDYGDIFQFWIEKETNIIDYFAYKFTAGSGGIRFRSAYNPRVVNGVRFQDYTNYKASSSTPFSKLPILFEEGKLKKLSEVKTENIKSLNN